MGPDVAIAGSNNIYSAFFRTNEVFSKFLITTDPVQKTLHPLKNGDSCLSFSFPVVLFAPLFLQHESGRCGRHSCGTYLLFSYRSPTDTVNLIPNITCEHALILERLLGQVL